MPAGVSWPRYLRMFGASVLAMFAGAQVVHQYYLPDLVRDKRNHLPPQCPVCVLSACSVDEINTTQVMHPLRSLKKNMNL